MARFVFIHGGLGRRAINLDLVHSILLDEAHACVSVSFGPDDTLLLTAEEGAELVKVFPPDPKPESSVSHTRSSSASASTGGENSWMR